MQTTGYNKDHDNSSVFNSQPFIQRFIRIESDCIVTEAETTQLMTIELKFSNPKSKTSKEKKSPLNFRMKMWTVYRNSFCVYDFHERIRVMHYYEFAVFIKWP